MRWVAIPLLKRGTRINLDHSAALRWFPPPVTNTVNCSVVTTKSNRQLGHRVQFLYTQETLPM